MNKFLKLTAYLDWVLGAVFLTWGLLVQNPWFIASGLLAFLAAWYKPAARVKAWVEKKAAVKKAEHLHTEAALNEDAFYARHAPVEKPGTPVVKPAYNRMLSYTSWGIANHPHNHIKPAHLNLYTTHSV